MPDLDIATLEHVRRLTMIEIYRINVINTPKINLGKQIGKSVKHFYMALGMVLFGIDSVPVQKDFIGQGQELKE